ncbi:carbohydrate porin [Terriglobus albidus]|uniref:carbohydrate porin n=1 Tax=Terriglobus albidus TaxID=1592106 RepID=UPI0021DFB797|nr:carbohydrate porin [Terriglobus albidus]
MSRTLFPHSNASPLYAAGQANIIFQAHPPFHSPYDGPNSMQARGEYKTSLVGTLFLGAQPHHKTRYNTDLILDIESAGGRGISQALGLAGFTNLDVVRNPNLGSKPYIARVQVHQTIGFTSEMVEAERTPFSMATQVPARRLEFRLGKMSLPDLFDQNAVGSDSHFQFTNWTVDNNGAWDYAADTRGYTYAFVAEYQSPAWGARYATALMPTVANGINLDWALRRANGQNAEVEWHRGLASLWLPKERKGMVRMLSFVNHADMGRYREAVQAYLTGQDATPNIDAHRRQSSVKYGFGINTEQEITADLRAFARWGWNEGQHESWAYTEVDSTIAAGADLQGAHWSRPRDKVGVAFVTNGIKRDHQNYLKYGGLGFLLGDGNLTYGRENILEAYYQANVARGLSMTLGMQYIGHPGYNRDRGPVLVPSVRTHVEF